MTQEMGYQSPAMNRKPLLLATALGMKDEERMIRNRDMRHRHNIGEVAGGAAAECAAVVCCCPCAVVDLLVLAVYKVPTGLCKKALKKNKRRRLLKKKNKSCSALEMNHHQRMAVGRMSGMIISNDAEFNAYSDQVVGVIDAVDLDSEMWDKFYGAGFWRSESQRED